MSEKNRPAGYLRLIRHYSLPVIANWHESYVALTNFRHTRDADTRVTDVYSAIYWPGESVAAHLEFALKYDGTNLQILAAIFKAMPARDLAAHIRSKPMGKYARRLWFLFEWITGKRLKLETLDRGVYLTLLETDEQYTSTGWKSPRQRIVCNALGYSANFCPTIRKTQKLQTFEKAKLSEQACKVIAQCPPDVLRRAMQYLYTKETKSSFAIEREEPSTGRTARFVGLLHDAERESYVTKEMLIRLQNQIVHREFRESDYRDHQNYVGETVAFGRERIHYMPPTPDSVASLMEALIQADSWMEASEVSPVIHATVVSFGFVFVHPFEDGNGRIHRFLIHNVLARRGFSPPGVIFPVSAVMLENMTQYNASLENFSDQLMPMVEYTLDADGRATVQTGAPDQYRYIDMTAQAEALFDFVESTISNELVAEIRYLRRYDQAKRLIQEAVDIPDRMIDLFIHCCAQNHGTLSKGKRKSHFSRLNDNEIYLMQQAFQRAQLPELIANLDR